ncbi:hypothetical protein D3C74_429090 [compost metagenome]
MENLSDCRMLQQIAGQRQRIALMPFHAQRECFHPLHQLVAVIWCQDCTQGIVQNRHFCRQPGTFGYDQSGKHIVVASQIFGRAMDDDIRPKLQRPLKKR